MRLFCKQHHRPAILTLLLLLLVVTAAITNDSTSATKWSDSRIWGGKNHCHCKDCPELLDPKQCSEKFHNCCQCEACTHILQANASPTVAASADVHTLTAVPMLVLFVVMTALRSWNTRLHVVLGQTMFFVWTGLLMVFLSHAARHTYLYVIVDEKAGMMNPAIWDKRYRMDTLFAPLNLYSFCCAVGIMVRAPPLAATDWESHIKRIFRATCLAMLLCIVSVVSLLWSACEMVGAVVLSSDSSLFVLQESTLIVGTFAVLMLSMIPVYRLVHREASRLLLEQAKAASVMRLWKLLHIPHAALLVIVFTLSGTHVAGHSLDLTVLQVATLDSISVSSVLYFVRKDLLWWFQQYQQQSSAASTHSADDKKMR